MRKLISDVGLANVAESIDRLMNVDIGARGTAQVLFDAARELLNGKPMTLAAVELMQKSIKPGDLSQPDGRISQPISRRRVRRMDRQVRRLLQELSA